MTKRVLIRRGKVASVGDDALARARHALEVHGVSGESVKTLLTYELVGSALAGPLTPKASKARQPRPFSARVGSNVDSAVHLSARFRVGK